MDTSEHGAGARPPPPGPAPAMPPRSETLEAELAALEAILPTTPGESRDGTSATQEPPSGG